jgi:predicted metal-dependent phosphotriesterase family hydrolase
MSTCLSDLPDLTGNIRSFWMGMPLRKSYVAWLPQEEADTILYIQNAVFPMLIEMGADEKELGQLFINGPRNYFEGR